MRKALKNVAGGLAGSFISRNNDYKGYWALGKMKAMATKGRSAEVKVTLVPSETRSAPPLVRQLSGMYRAMMERLLDRAGSSMHGVAFAEIATRFELDPVHAEIVPWPTWGDPFCCEVTIVDVRGNTFRQKRYSLCGSHNPSRERRSAKLPCLASAAPSAGRFASIDKTEIVYTCL
jgi:hypothetical protein